MSHVLTVLSRVALLADMSQEAVGSYFVVLVSVTCTPRVSCTVPHGAHGELRMAVVCLAYSSDSSQLFTKPDSACAFC